MGLHEDMQHQQAALEAEAKQRAHAEEVRNRQLNDATSKAHAFLKDFVKEARTRGIRPSSIPAYIHAGYEHNFFKRLKTRP
jgi:hypothetical protein